MNHISVLDFLGMSPTFLIEGRKQKQTFFGGLLSIAVALMLLSATGYFLGLLFSREEYQMILTDEYNTNSFKDWTNEEFSITLVSSLLEKIPNAERVYGITGTWWHDRENVDPNSKETASHKLEINEIKLETCNVTRHFPDSAELWSKEKHINQSMCIQRDQMLNSSKMFGADNYSGIVMYIHRCKNSTTKKDCLPQEEIEKALDKVYFMVRFKDI